MFLFFHYEFWVIEIIVVVVDSVDVVIVVVVTVDVVVAIVIVVVVTVDVVIAVVELDVSGWATVTTLD